MWCHLGDSECFMIVGILNVTLQFPWGFRIYLPSIDHRAPSHDWLTVVSVGRRGRYSDTKK